MNERKFTPDDQQMFARLSGDNNPIHVDPIAARRSAFGRPIVHGIHTVLWALDCWLANRSTPLRFTSITASFLKPVLLGEAVRCNVVVPAGDQHVRMELTCRSSLSAKIKFECDVSGRPRPDHCKSGFPELRPPRLLSVAELHSSAGALDLYLDRFEVARLFPNLERCAPPAQIAALLAASRLVGVECPGLYSIFSEFALSAVDSDGAPTLSFRVKAFDERFGMVAMDVVSPAMTGFVKAFVRPSPQVQASFSSAKALVKAQEFAGQRAVIIGGSRGLGEVTAKLLCAGGASARITYFQGEGDARRVINEIVSGQGEADCFQFNVLDPREDGLDSILSNWLPTHLYYFATPLIPSGKKGAFSTEVFNELCAYYVTGFARTVHSFKRLGVRSVFYPSTVFVDEVPANMGEYAAAKMAGEVVCRFLVRTVSGLFAYSPRLPRMATDQTSSVTSVNASSPGPIILDALRAFQAEDGARSGVVVAGR